MEELCSESRSGVSSAGSMENPQNQQGSCSAHKRVPEMTHQVYSVEDNPYSTASSREKGSDSALFSPMKAMVAVARAALLSMTAAACLCCSASATSIIIYFKSDRIILLADSRAVQLNPSGNTVADDYCKIVALGGRFVFAETGREGYKPAGPTDSVPEWHGTSEAVKAYRSVPDHDPYKVALRWAIQVTDDFQLFYLSDPLRVRRLARPGVPLLLGIFAGKDSEGVLKAYKVTIALDDSLLSRERTSIPIGYAVDDIPPRDEPYSTNAVTQELLDGNTNRAKEVETLWGVRSHHIPQAERGLRRLEFLIEETGNYDREVHGPVNAIQVTRNSLTWLHNKTCEDKDQSD